MYYDDYFNEPNEYEHLVDEFKQSLVRAVKKEHQDEIERLRAENLELQSVKSRMKEIESEHKNALHQLKIKEEETKRIALRRLLEETKLIMYVVKTTYEKKDKCDKCNDKRVIEYMTPLGKKASEDCLCKKDKEIYIPTEALRYEFCEDRWHNRKIVAWYKIIEKDEDHICLGEYDSGSVRKCYDGETPYEELKRWDVMFKTEEDCQKYCNWLNKKES